MPPPTSASTANRFRMPPGQGSKACHRPGTAGRIYHRHGQLDHVLPFVSQPAHTVSGGSDGLAARWSGRPGGAGIGDRRRGCGRLLRSDSSARRSPAVAGVRWSLLRQKSCGVVGTLAIAIRPVSSSIKSDIGECPTDTEPDRPPDLRTSVDRMRTSNSAAGPVNVAFAPATIFGGLTSPPASR